MTHSTTDRKSCISYRDGVSMDVRLSAIFDRSTQYHEPALLSSSGGWRSRLTTSVFGLGYMIRSIAVQSPFSCSFLKLESYHHAYSYTIPWKTENSKNRPARLFWPNNSRPEQLTVDDARKILTPIFFFAPDIFAVECIAFHEEKERDQSLAEE